jgi:hypothetical protein
MKFKIGDVIMNTKYYQNVGVLFKASQKISKQTKNAVFILIFSWGNRILLEAGMKN